MRYLLLLLIVGFLLISCGKQNIESLAEKDARFILDNIHSPGNLIDFPYSVDERLSKGLRDEILRQNWENEKRKINLICQDRKEINLLGIYVPNAALEEPIYRLDYQYCVDCFVILTFRVKENVPKFTGIWVQAISERPAELWEEHQKIR
jgi:hypothetical protein